MRGISEKAVWIQDPFHMPDDESFSYRDWDRSLDICYPREHSELFEKICEYGVLLSEYPPGMPAKPYHFPQRNRLIAAWSGEMHIIGAGRNSGTRITQQYFEKYHGTLQKGA